MMLSQDTINVPDTSFLIVGDFNGHSKRCRDIAFKRAKLVAFIIRTKELTRKCHRKMLSLDTTLVPESGFLIDRNFNSQPQR
ncbi:hypothetical protein DPMN_048480 [Dreissena polymorpha]|uniref:Uncharacterized protein n=1 Tax=Dreissena polymorpha TaxID=45954 RepID=A0A9D4DBA7_DREPO|nr:hypothetical protein DPMN_048480 [Dreissena polymorpha]